jgi:WD40 repeat protein
MGSSETRMSSNQESTLIKGRMDYSVDKELESHTGSVFCLVEINFELIATGSADTTIKIWNIRTGNIVFTLSDNKQGKIICLLKINDQTIASASKPKKERYRKGRRYYKEIGIRIWDITNGQMIKKLSKHTDYVTSLTKLNDSFVLSGSMDKTMKIWSTSKWKLKKTINTPRKISYLLLLNPERVAVAQHGGKQKYDENQKNQSGYFRDYKIRIYKINSGKLKHEMKGHTGVITSMIQLNITNQIISGSYDRTIRRWDINRGILLGTVIICHEICSLVNLNNGLIAVGLNNPPSTSTPNIALISTNSWCTNQYLDDSTIISNLQSIFKRIEKINCVNSLILLSDGRLLSGSSNKKAVIWK